MLFTTSGTRAVGAECVYRSPSNVNETRFLQLLTSSEAASITLLQEVSKCRICLPCLSKTNLIHISVSSLDLRSLATLSNFLSQGIVSMLTVCHSKGVRIRFQTRQT